MPYRDDAPPPSSERLAYSVKEAAALVDLSEAEGYRLIARGAWPAIRVGRRTLIARVDLEAWLDRKRAEADIIPTPTRLRRRA